MVVFMGSYRDRYIELHGLEFDFYHSACGTCPHAWKEGCQYYYGKCPQGGTDDELDCE